MKKILRLNEVAKNLLNLTSINVLNLLVTLVTIPFLSRVLGPEHYGYYFIFISASLFATILTDYSTQITGVRDVAKNKDPRQLPRLYAQYQAVRFVAGLFSCLIFTVYTACVIPGISLPVIATYYLIVVCGHYLTASWFHQGISQLSALAVATLLPRLVHIVALLLWVRSPADMLLAVFINALAYLLTGLYAVKCRHTQNGLRENVEFTGLWSRLCAGRDSFIGDFAPNLYSNIPLLIIGSLVSPAVFAGFSIAMRLVAIAGSVQLMLSKAAYPIIAKGKGTFGRLLQLNVLLSALPVLAIFMFGDRCVTLFLGSGYPDVTGYLKLLSAGILFNGMLTAYSYGYFLPRHLDREFRNISLFVSLVSAVTGYVLIYLFSVTGAIAMFVFARMLFVMCYALTHRRLSRR
ncbi:lipopolysaccharide biosynthesis protein [Rahnella rivi]|uniref:lipopolysaccharide biosynthesis protein n=1 Tax=Rahnella rivi TaxID=2816249 RepID=UPI0039BEAB87